MARQMVVGLSELELGVGLVVVLELELVKVAVMSAVVGTHEVVGLAWSWEPVDTAVLLCTPYAPENSQSGFSEEEQMARALPLVGFTATHLCTPNTSDWNVRCTYSER